MSLCNLLRRSSLLHRTYPVSFLNQRFYNVSVSTVNQDTDTNQDSDGQHFQIPTNHSPRIPSSISSSPISFPIPQRTMAFSSAEEAAAERRRRKRRLRIEPPLHALRRDPSAPPPLRDPNAPRLPDSTSALVGARLNLHNRVQSLIRASDLDAASRLARQSVFSNTRPTVFTCNAIIAAMYRAKRYSESISLFQYFFKQSNIVPNVVSYNQIINAHCDEGRVDEALEVYHQILANAPFGPSSVTFRHLTKGFVEAGRIGEAVSLVREMLSKGQAADSMVYNNVIRGFLDLGDLDKANEFFDELKTKCTVYDGIVNATFMEYWFKQGKDEEAMESYRSLLEKKFRMHPPTGNVLLEVFLKYGKKTEAWDLFNEMLDNHTPPNILSVNSDTISIMVNECFKMGQFTEAIDTFKKVGSKTTSKPFVMDYVGYCNIITRFCEHGMLPEAERFFAESVSKSLPPDASSHRAMINAYLKAERIDDALQMLNRMVDVNLRVVANFGTRVFGELIKNGKLTESAEVLTKMGEKEPKPDPSIYDVVVRGLCDGDSLEQAKDIIGQMIGHGVGVVPVLREFVIETFEKAGRREEIEKTLSSTIRHGRNPNQSRSNVPRVTREPSVFGTTQTSPQRPSGSYQNTGQQSSQTNTALWMNQRSGLPHSGWTNAAAAQTEGAYKADGQNPSWSNPSVNQQQPSWSQPQPSWSSSQAPGHQQKSWSPATTRDQTGWSSPTNPQQSWSPPPAGEQSRWSNPTNPQQSWSPPAPGEQSKWSNPTIPQQSWSPPAAGEQSRWSSPTSPQQSWSPPAGEQQPSWSRPTSHQQSWANQATGQQSTWSGQQQSWANQTPGQQQQSTWTGQQQSWANPGAGQPSQWSNTVAEQKQSWANPAAGQQSQWSNTVAEQKQSWANQPVGQQAQWSGSVDGHRPRAQQQEPGSSHDWHDREQNVVDSNK